MIVLQRMPVVRLRIATKPSGSVPVAVVRSKSYPCSGVVSHHSAELCVLGFRQHQIPLDPPFVKGEDRGIYFFILRRIATSPSRPEPSSQAAAGMGTALPSILTKSTVSISAAVGFPLTIRWK